MEWNGEKAWSSESGTWRAIVSEPRARLIYLGPTDETHNLLYAPAAPEKFRPRGGHIVWLGPQSEWTGKWGTWPPPDEWEQMPGLRIQQQEGWLEIVLPRPNEKLPQVTRSYRWTDGTLQCRMFWSGGQGDFQGLHILQLPAGATVRAERLAPEVPGFVRFDTLGKQSFEAVTLGRDTTLVSERIVEIAADQDPAKFGFYPQTLLARVGNFSVAMGREKTEGIIVNAPDQGFETQVYFGGTKFPFTEIEQLTPRLKNRGEEANGFTIWVRPGASERVKE
jgi:hypothetical protein